MWITQKHFVMGVISTWGLILIFTLNTNLKLMGEGCIDILREKANDTSLGRSAKREVKDIAKHYRKNLNASTI